MEQQFGHQSDQHDGDDGDPEEAGYGVAISSLVHGDGMPVDYNGMQAAAWQRDDANLGKEGGAAGGSRVPRGSASMKGHGRQATRGVEGGGLGRGDGMSMESTGMQAVAWQRDDVRFGDVGGTAGGSSVHRGGKPVNGHGMQARHGATSGGLGRGDGRSAENNGMQAAA